MTDTGVSGRVNEVTDAASLRNRGTDTGPSRKSRIRSIAFRAVSITMVVPFAFIACSKTPLEDRLVAKDQATRAQALQEAGDLALPDRNRLAQPLTALLHSTDRATRMNAAEAVIKLRLENAGLRDTVLDVLMNAGTEEAIRTAFLYRVAGRWNSAFFRKGNTMWWPGHDSSAPKTKTHYLFGPKELLIESRPEFRSPSITEHFVYGSIKKAPADMFDVELRGPERSATEETKRFRFLPDRKTLEIATDAERDPEPTVHILELVDATWTPDASNAGH
jgi:hypothetical protein